jgi:hypothetical protein
VVPYAIHHLEEWKIIFEQNFSIHPSACRVTVVRHCHQRLEFRSVVLVNRRFDRGKMVACFQPPFSTTFDQKQSASSRACSLHLSDKPGIYSPYRLSDLDIVCGRSPDAPVHIQEEVRLLL